MNRKEFLIGLGTALVTAPALFSLQACGKKSDETAAPANNGFSVQSSVTGNHTHNIFFPFSDLASPPSGGKNYTSDGSHVHTITLTQQQLTDINSDRTESVVSNPDATGHSHTWTITKPA